MLQHESLWWRVTSAECELESVLRLLSMLATIAESAAASSISIEPPSLKQNALISAEMLKQLYVMMLKLRMLTQRSKNAASRRLRFVEACEVGALIDLRAGDTIASIRDQEIQLLTRLIGNGPDQRNPLTVLPHGAKHRLAIATGVAFAIRAQNKDDVVVAFAQPAEIPSSDDAVKFAIAQSLPIIYVILPEANSRKPDKSLFRSATYDCLIPVDQSDAVAVYRVAYEAIDKARRGAGPTLIRCIRGRVTAGRKRPDDPHCSDPIAYMEYYLRKKSSWDDALRTNVEREFSGMPNHLPSQNSPSSRSKSMR